MVVVVVVVVAVAVVAVAVVSAVAVVVVVAVVSTALGGGAVTLVDFNVVFPGGVLLGMGVDTIASSASRAPPPLTFIPNRNLAPRCDGVCGSCRRRRRRS